MSDLSRLDPTGRFSGLADVYARFRPSYPDAAVDLILRECGLRPGSVLVDVGCGTGISSRLFAARGLRVLGVEPNDAMRTRAQAEPDPSGNPPEYHPGQAEETGLPGGCSDAVLAAQAFHWFDAPRALAEFRRILRPGGGVALMWNERDETDPATADFGRVIRSSSEAAAVEGPRGRAGEALLHTPLFRDARRVVVANEQEVDEEGLLGRAFSASYAPREPAAAAAFADALRAVFVAHQQRGKFLLRYQTSVYLARSPRPNE
jgi:SAM-dependent methyltransferase